MQLAAVAIHDVPLNRHVLKYALQFAALGLAIVSVHALDTQLAPLENVHLLPELSIRLEQFVKAPLPVVLAVYPVHTSLKTQAEPSKTQFDR